MKGERIMWQRGIGIHWWAAAIILFAVSSAFGAEPMELSLKVMTFNLRYGTAKDGEDDWEHRRDMVARTIRDVNPDVMGTQECILFQAECLADQLPEYYWFGIGRDRDGDGESCAVFYRKDLLNLVESGTFWLSEDPDTPGSRSWDSSMTRCCTWAKFYHREARRFFYFFNTHFDHKGEESRRQAARLIVERTAKIPSDIPIVVSGDFNATAGREKPWEIFTDAGFTDAWRAAKETKGSVQTFNGFQPIDPKPTENRIDWILFKGSVSVPLCETIMYQEGGRWPSDHFPVHADLLLRYPAP